MISRSVRIQLVAFVLITLATMSYLGLRLIGIEAFRPPFVVKASFESSGGIFTNAEVTYRGVGVGRVGELRLLPDGVEVELKLEQGTKVPQNTIAVVANKSAVGEQYVDLQPRTAGGPYLGSGDRITRANTRIPIDINTVVVDLDRLARSVDLVALRTLINELGDAFEGTGPVLRELIESGDALTRTMTEKLPETIQLINEGRAVLQTARDTSTDFRRFARGLADLSESIRTVDPDVRRLLDNGVVAARELDALLAPRQQALHVLLSDLVTLNRLQVQRLDGVRQTLASLPLVVERVPLALVDGQLRNGLVNEHDAPACVYPDTERRLPRDYSPQEPNRNAECPAGTGGQRGAHTVHDRSGTLTAPASTPSGPSAPAKAPVRPGAEPALRWTGGQQDALGSKSWVALLLALL